MTQTANLPGKIGGKIRQLEGEAALDPAVLRRHKILGGGGERMRGQTQEK